MERDGSLKIFTGNANPELSKEIAQILGVPVIDSVVTQFSDGETQLQINESVRGADVFIIQPTSQPVNEYLMELLIIIDAVRRASARRITAVIPYYGYARQERKSKARDPITAKLVANLIVAAGARRVVSMDLHANAIQGFFDIPFDHLPGAPILAEYYKKLKLSNICVVSPDLGGVTRARDLANRIGAEFAIIEKRRPKANVSEVLNVLGDVNGMDCILVDDMIDTAGTITKGAELLKKFGAKTVRACCTHAVLSGPAIERIQASSLKEVVVTNTIRLPEEKKIDKIKILSVAQFLSKAILNIHADESVSRLIK
ncbi:MAG: ribose-phosphate pyrophosphokinase [Fusobacteria bacterium]|nr:MAG: ribose-phosphate pyrophosphokinase [Fusobacteriota bacterium]KAF0228870.1 MAG: ribose-phosphate [Fusobacteriota bacterium]